MYKFKLNISSTNLVMLCNNNRKKTILDKNKTQFIY